MLTKTRPYLIEGVYARQAGLKYVWKGAEDRPLDGPMPGSIVLDQSGDPMGVVTRARTAFDNNGQPIEDYFSIDPNARPMSAAEAASRHYEGTSDGRQQQLEAAVFHELVHT